MNECGKIKIGKLFNVEKGSLQSSKCVSGDYDFITASSEWKTHKEYSHHTEALIVAVAASGSLGRVHYVNGKFISSDLCFILTPKDAKTYPVDLGFYLHVFKAIRQDLVQRTATGTSKLAINKGNFENYEVPYFDIVHQGKYREKLIKFETQKGVLLEKGSTQKSLLKSLRQHILEDAIRGDLTKDWREQNPDVEPACQLLKRIDLEKEKLIKEKKIKKERKLSAINNHDILFGLPSTWQWVRLGNLKTLSDYGTSEKAYEDIAGFPVLAMGNINGGKVSLVANKNLSSKSNDLPRLLLRNRDVLFNRTNSWELVGKTGLFEGEDDRFTFASYLIRLRFLDDLVSAEYVNFYLNSKSFRETQIEPQIIQQCGQANFNGTKLGNSIFPLPPFSEQIAIVAKVNSLFEYCDQIEDLMTQNKQNTASLMQVFLAEAFKS